MIWTEPQNKVSRNLNNHTYEEITAKYFMETMQSKNI